MRVILDTQVVSFAKKGILPLPSGFSITSTVAQEFLRVREKSTGGARYFTPPPQGLSPDGRANYLAGRSIHGGDRPSNRPLFKKVTDKVVMDFNNEYPSVVEYGHLGISHLINTANRGIYIESITHLPKHERKNLIENFEFLADHRAECIPVDSDCVSIAFFWLREMVSTGMNLKADFRNSLNDMLILATARSKRLNLWTMDELLAQFAREHDVSEVASQGDFYELAFSDVPGPERRESRESKGYRNTGWRFAIHRAPVPAGPVTR